MKIMRATTVAAVALLAVAGGVIAGTIAWRDATVKESVQKDLRDLINAEHFRVCGEYLDHDGQLKDIATYKAIDSALRDRLEHTFEDGTRVWDYYARAGIPRTYGSGEIVGVNNYSDGTTAQAVFDGWMDSDAHRPLIRNCDYDRFGVGVYKIDAGNLKWYAVEFTNVTE